MGSPVALRNRTGRRRFCYMSKVHHESGLPLRSVIEPQPRGAQWVLFALLLVWVADSGAFFFGRRYGRVRLAPDVSPGKTWEGVLGGVAVSALVAVGGSVWFGVPLPVFVPLCLAVVGFSIVGDLTESLLKRFAGLKDSGTLFPGHGGVMDRIDSVTGAAPVLFFGLALLGVVA